jgi:hypothetical protein
MSSNRTVALVSGVGQGGQLQLGHGPVQGAGDVVQFGARQIMQVSGRGVGGSDR